MQSEEKVERRMKTFHFTIKMNEKEERTKFQFIPIYNIIFIFQKIQNFNITSNVP